MVAVDYLMKPYDRERFGQAIGRVRAPLCSAAHLQRPCILRRAGSVAENAARMSETPHSEAPGPPLIDRLWQSSATRSPS